MKECSKSIVRRMHAPDFINSFFVGNGLYIGGKPDPLSLYKDFFSKMGNVKTWDWEDGDAQFLHGVDDASFDFVHSSPCLEHLINPTEGLQNWLRVLKEGGYLIVTIPDEDLYEQGKFPSTFNLDHKWTFTIFKTLSWSNNSINVMELLKKLGPEAEVIKIELLSSTYRFNLPRYDQTLTPISECGIEFIVRKRSKFELDNFGSRDRNNEQPNRETLIHLNQYRNDLKILKDNNKGVPPFTDDSPIE